MLISLSVDEILLPKYVNWSTNFRDLILKSGDSSILVKKKKNYVNVIFPERKMDF